MKRIIVAAALAACAGCFTMYETPYPEVQMSAAGEKSLSVQLSGFEAAITSYIPVYGYETHYHCGYGRRGGYWGPYTVATQTYIPQTSQTETFRDRAAEMLEASGFNLRSDKPDYSVEVKFSGPFITNKDRCIEATCTILSLLTADYGVQKWTARLKIYDSATGRLLMHSDYERRYQAVVWGPLPLFSPAGSDRTEFNTIQCWCLSALTDQAVADASAFMASHAGQSAAK